MKAIANFLRLQDRYGLAEGVWLEIKKQGYRDYLKIADSIRGGHWRTGEHARAPGLLSQSFGKHRRKLVQFIHVLRVALERERELPRLLKIAIVNLETLHRRKLAGQNIEDFGIKLQRRHKNCDAGNGQQSHAAPHQRASLGYGSGDEITNAHERATTEHELAPGCQCCGRDR